MPIKKVFIIVPAVVEASPIKGAAALANALSQWVSVVFVSLKLGNDSFDLLHDVIEKESLCNYKNWYVKIKKLREILKESGDSQSVATISSGLSADFANSFCVDLAISCASVRGNLPVNYVFTYGFMGRAIAYLHLKRLSKIRYVVSMTTIMAEQVQEYIGKKSSVIGNFIDEERLNHYKKRLSIEDAYRFIFIGSLTKRKQPLLLMKAVATLVEKGKNIKLDIVGDGSLMDILRKTAIRLKIVDRIVFHGYIKEPYKFLENADVLVLPSFSEGVSRSALEALYLGVPCVLRDVDGASELIHDGINGYLFNENSELPNAMMHAVELSRNRDELVSLLPDKYRQKRAARQFLELLESRV